MSDSLYEVAFSGQIQEGAELATVKAGIARMFKADEATLAQLFSGKRIVIKTNMSEAAADRYSKAFTRAGAICELTLMSADITPHVPPTESAGPVDRAASSKGKRGFRKKAAISALAVVVVAAIGVATPYFTGMLAEQKYRDGMLRFEELAVQQSASFTIKNDVDYRRGWLSSTVVNTITLELPERDPIIFDFNSNISHGPLLMSGPNKFGLAAIETKMPLTENQQAGMAEIWKGNKNPIQVRSHIDFNGNALTEVSMAGFTLENIGNNPAGRLSVETLSTRVTFSDHFTRADADMDWNGMQLDTPEAKVVVGKLTIHSEKQLAAEDLWLGDDELNLSTVSVNVSNALTGALGATAANSTVEELAVFAHSEMDSSNLVKGHTTITVNNIVVENRSVSSDFKLTIAVERLPAKPLQAITRKMSEHQNRAISSGNPRQTPDFALIRDDVAAILVAGPVLKITTLQANTEHGKVEADLEASIKIDDPVMLQNPMLLLFAIQAAGNVSLPERLIENTPLAIFVPGFVGQGYIVSEQGQLKTSMKFRQGQLTLNGKALQQ